jgi:hypothetical protein
MHVLLFKLVTAVRRSSDPLEKISFFESKNMTESNGIKVVAVPEFRQKRLSYYLDLHYNWQLGFVCLFLVVGLISTAAMKAYCTLTPQWSSVIHLQRRCTPSGVRDLS